MCFKKNFNEVWMGVVKEYKYKALSEGYQILNSEQDIQIFTKNNFDNWISLLTKDEKDALFQYTGNVYQPINSYFRGVQIENNYLKNIINNIDASLSRAILKENILTFRWENYGGLDYKIQSKSKKVKSGLYLNIQEYLSTTLLPYNRINQATYSNDEQVLMIIKLDKGINCAPVYLLSSNAHEYELLINRGYILEIEEILYKKRKSYILVCKIIK